MALREPDQNADDVELQMTEGNLDAVRLHNSQGRKHEGKSCTDIWSFILVPFMITFLRLCISFTITGLHTDQAVTVVTVQ